jgi:hypothetical protein
MKQPEDNKTMDLLGGGGNTPKPVERCVFWIECANNGEIIEWQPLTKTQAVRMHKCTERTLPHNVSRHGWEVLD